jgi:hypothetical protein
MPFGDSEDDLALMLHARAYGEDVGGDVRGESGPLTLLAERIQDPEVCGPLVPDRLIWGPRAALAPQVRAALASPLLRAWVATDNDGPVQALVFGEGLPEIRHQIVQAALTTSLRINGMTDPQIGDFVGDHIGVGLIRIMAGLSGNLSAIDVPSVFDARRVVVPDRSSPSTRGALRDFVALLRSGERETNLVQVTDVDYADVVAFTDGYRALADRASAETDRAFLRLPAKDSKTPTGLVTLQPFLRTASRQDTPAGMTVGLELSPDILTTESYLDLEQAHHRVLGERLIMDAKLRRDRLEAEIEWMTNDLEAFTKAGPSERQAFWDSTVLLVERFDERMGVTIQLAEPEECSTAEYYRSNAPRAIKSREGWARRMTELAEHLEAAVARQHAPARQLAAGRFIDAVLRGVVPDEGTAIERAFSRWRQEVAPMLWFEWRCALRRQRIDPADLFTQHTVLITRYLPPVGDDPGLLVIQPHTLVDQARSAVLADAERGVLVVRDGTDHAEPEAGNAAESAVDAAAVWADLARLAGQKSSGEEFNRTFLEALRAYPQESVRRMIEELQPAEPGPTEADTIDQELRLADRATSIRDGMERALIAMRTSAFITAREALNDIHGEPQWEARAWLLRAIVECAAVGHDYREIPHILGDQVPGLPADAFRALHEAASLDDEYARKWLRALPETDLDRAIRRLFQGLPRARASCATERRYAVWLFRRAIESARLARQLEKAGEELNEKQEAVDAALVKLGRALEEVLVGRYAAGSRSEALDLFEILTLREPPRHGRVR